LSERHAIAFEPFRKCGKNTISSGNFARMKACSDKFAAPAHDTSGRAMARQSTRRAALLLDRPAIEIGFQA
jgi:hypothetical protein